MRSVVVTGASSGIGLSTAKMLLAEGFRVFGGVLTPAEAREAAGVLGPNFTPLVFDITDEAGTCAAACEVRAVLGGWTLAGLVNNAGIAIQTQPLLDVPVDEFRRQIEINLIGQLIVTRAFAPLLGADAAYPGPPGRIVMMSSIAGKVGWPLGGAYAASKHGLEGLSESLRRELMLFGIDVIIIEPAVVDTAIWKPVAIPAGQHYANAPYAEPMRKMREFTERSVARGLSPERVAQLVLKALTAKRPRLRYAITQNPMSELLIRILPKRLVDRIIGKKLLLLPRRPSAK